MLQAELDKAVAEKNGWLEKYARIHSTEQISRANVWLLQRESASLKEQLAEAKQRASAWEKAAISARADARSESMQEPADFEMARDKLKSLNASQQEEKTTDAELSSLRMQLLEERDRRADAEREAEAQRNQAGFFKASAEAYQQVTVNGKCLLISPLSHSVPLPLSPGEQEADLLREKLLAQHGINDDTSEEMLKMLQDLGQMRQAIAQLKTDLSVKVDMGRAGAISESE